MPRINAGRRENNNERMHPRNFYAHKRPNFAALARTYEDLRAFVKGRKGSIDFRDPDATRQLTIALLKDDFALSVTLPPDNLCPVLANRLNYLHWIEDVLGAPAFTRDSSIRGVDIGCGASCIYALLGCRLHPGWSFDCLEIDASSASVARDNVARNAMSDRIRVIEPPSALRVLQLPDTEQIYSFVMCNPPFYASDKEMLNSTERKHTCASSNIVGTASEKVTNGGEFAFVQSMIEESYDLRDRVECFTSMIGIKRNFTAIQQILRLNKNIKQYKTTAFYQGRTVRWAVAWSYRISSLEGVFDASKINGEAAIVQFLGGERPSESDTPYMTIWSGVVAESYRWDALWDRRAQSLHLKGVEVCNLQAWSLFCGRWKSFLGLD